MPASCQGNAAPRGTQVLGERLGAHPVALQLRAPHCSVHKSLGHGLGMVHSWVETAQKSRTGKRPEVCINILSACHLYDSAKNSGSLGRKPQF